MANPFNIRNTPSNDIKQMYQAFSQSNNPMAMFMNMTKNNPQLQGISQALSQGANPQSLFYSLCQQRGINPQEFINNLTKR